MAEQRKEEKVQRKIWHSSTVSLTGDLWKVFYKRTNEGLAAMMETKCKSLNVAFSRIFHDTTENICHNRFCDSLFYLFPLNKLPQEFLLNCSFNLAESV